MECFGQAPGFFGKLPSHGDFVSRRLPLQVRQCLDDWLQRALMHSKAELGPAWLATWGSSPLWRFVIGAGVCGEQAWAGVMMPSADRVGRCFPLLLAASPGETPALAHCPRLFDDWLARLEALALSALEDGFSLEVFDADLIAAGAAPSAGVPARLTLDRWQPTPPEGFVMVLQGSPAPECSLEGQSAWWTQGSPLISPCMATCAGLPGPASFTALLDGRWVERGWSMLPALQALLPQPGNAGC